MSDKTKRLTDYLGHILQAIDRIKRYTAGFDETDFLKNENEMAQDAVIRNIEIIGEASNRIKKMAPEFVAKHADLPWLDMYDMRNKVSHYYEGVDFQIVWETARNDLPVLHQQVTQTLEGIGQDARQEQNAAPAPKPNTISLSALTDRQAYKRAKAPTRPALTQEQQAALRDRLGEQARSVDAAQQPDPDADPGL